MTPESSLKSCNHPALPRWLKRNVPKGNANHFTAKLIGQLGLQTVCDHAKCPNRMECYSQKTATFMILGNVCTRACRFCSVPKGKPQPPDPDEPRRVAEAARKLGLKHIVITCVTRDDLPDGGAEQFARTIEEIRRTKESSGQSAVGSQQSAVGSQQSAVGSQQ
ncbi:MAG: radical SAM protein, partial [Thermoguttaceae bacterium]